MGISKFIEGVSKSPFNEISLKALRGLQYTPEIEVFGEIIPDPNAAVPSPFIFALWERNPKMCHYPETLYHKFMPYMGPPP